MAYQTYRTDKTHLEIKNALLAGKDVLLKINNQTICKIVGFEITSFSYNDQTQYTIYYDFQFVIVNFSLYGIEILSQNYYSTFEQAENNEDYPYVYIEIDSDSSQ